MNNLDNDRKYFTKDYLMLGFTILIGFLFNDLLLFNGLGIGVTLFIFIFYAITFWYLKQKGQIINLGLDLFIPIILLALTFSIFTNYFLLALNLLLLFMLMIIHVTQISGNIFNRKYSIYVIFDILQTMILLPILRLGESFKISSISVKNTNNKKLGFILIGLFLTIPLALITIAILMSADAAFEGLINKIFNVMSKIAISDYIYEVLLGILFSIPIFGTLYSLKHKKLIIKKPIGEKLYILRKVDNTIINTMLFVLNGIYFLYILAQLSYFISAFKFILPDGFSFAEYARRGFFELQFLEIINFVFIIAVYLFSKRFEINAKITKALSTSLITITIFILISAITKMILYVNSYGLSLLRVYTTWFMILTGIIFILLALKLHIKRFAFIKWSSLIFIVLFIVLNYINVDYLIPKYNIEQYNIGNLKSIDATIFNGLSDSMVPAVIPLLDEKNVKYKIISRSGEEYEESIDIKELLENRKDRITSWQNFNYSSYYADKILEQKLGKK